MFASIVEVYCVVDEFCKEFKRGNDRFLSSSDSSKRNKASRMSLSEIMTIVILFHISGYRTFKHYYRDCVVGHLKTYFPEAVSYNRFIELIPTSLMPLTVFLYGLSGKETGKYFADSTTLEVCHNKRAKRNKVFNGLAKKGKNSMGWFFGLKLHLVINDQGEIMSCCLTKGNVDDRSPVPKLVDKLKGWLFADKGYLGLPLINKLKAQSMEIFTKVRKGMKQRPRTTAQEFFLSKRGLIETVIDQLKNYCQIEHSRHRSPANAFVNIVSAIIAYCFKPRKPSIKSNRIHNKNLLLISN